MKRFSNCNKVKRRYQKELEEVIETLDLEKFKQFLKRWQAMGMYEWIPKDERVIEMSMYKIASHLTVLPEETKKKARQWLLEHGSSTDMN